MKKCEIWTAEFSQIASGHEQTGFRPAIILAEIASFAVVIPLSTNLQTLKFPYTLEIMPSGKNKLKELSIALVFQIRAIDKKRIKNKIGDTESGLLIEIERMLRRLLQI